MAHFEPPANARTSQHYSREGVDTKRVWVGAGKPIDVVLRGGKGMTVVPRSLWYAPAEQIVRILEGKPPTPLLRLFHLQAGSPGRVLLEAKTDSGFVWATVTIDVLRSVDAQLTAGILNTLNLNGNSSHLAKFSVFTLIGEKT